MTDSPQSFWWVYVLISRSGSNRTYVGMTTDPQRRVRQHNGELRGGARCTAAHRPWALGVVYGPYPDRVSALKAEYALKHGKRGHGRLAWSPKDSPHFRPPQIITPTVTVDPHGGPSPLKRDT